ncbi:hypothetical protein [Phreatobacter stygius]|uniref:Uncharacterized protein n=1 Tax=Phreatobacter stygius TaxID=1940610 RepID=A0A4D7B632_9HYPH|nr:hypothetical protein [Phreatobacter stygius]QCI65610.1 hypothetical protein E8M01_16180 [Phreatobacter stygius]
MSFVMSKEWLERQLRASRRCAGPGLLALAAAVAVVPLLLTAPASADRFGGAPGGDRFQIEDPRNRVTVSVRTVPVGAFCVRAVEAVGYDPRLNQRLYHVRFNSGVMASLGVTAYENALSSARTERDAVQGLEYAQRDAAPFRRNPGDCI